MKLKILLPLLIILSIKSFAQKGIVFGQGYLILKDNSRIKYDKFKTRKQDLLVKVSNESKKRKIAIAEVVGYYHANEKIFFYKKPLECTHSINCDFVQKETCGKINLFKKEVTKWRPVVVVSTIAPGISRAPSSNNNYISEYHYYIEKSDKFENILIEKSNKFEDKINPSTSRKDKKNNIKILKSLVSDNQEILGKIDDDFKLNSKNLINIIKAYNLANYEKKIPHDTATKSKLIIYRYDRGDADEREKAIIHIEDSTYSLSTKKFCEIKINPNEITKICFGRGDESCELVEGSPYLNLYYELSLNAKGVYTFERKPKTEADRFLKGIYYYEKRNKSD